MTTERGSPSIFVRGSRRMLLGRAPFVVEGQHPLIGQAAISDDEAGPREQLARMELDNGHALAIVPDAEQVRMGGDPGGEVSGGCRRCRDQLIKRFRQPSGVIPR